jgi:hypothetical protein
MSRPPLIAALCSKAWDFAAPGCKFFPQGLARNETRSAKVFEPGKKAEAAGDTLPNQFKKFLHYGRSGAGANHLTS